MYATTATLGFLSVQGTLRAFELAIHLFAFLFPQQVVIRDNSSYDFIIVGGGTAGCVLARRLSDNENFNVLLIEAGGDPPLEVMLPGLSAYTQASKFDWNYTSVRNDFTYQCCKDEVFRATRGHGLGGTGGVNYMIYARGDPNDYKRWADIAEDPTWNYENVLPYFKKCERNEDQAIMNSKYAVFHGTEGEMGVNRFPNMENQKYLKALSEVGHKTVLDTSGTNTLGFNHPLYNIAEGKRQTSCYCYISPVKDRKNLHVLKNTRVTKVVFHRKKAIGVQVITESNKKIVINAKLEVILSAGAYNSPQLLMLSGIGPKQHLKSHDIKTLVDLPVGYNLQDHVGVTIVHQTERLQSQTPPPLNPFMPSSYLNGFISLNKSQTYPDLQIILAPARDGHSVADFYALSLLAKNDITQTAYNAGKNHEAILAFLLNMRPLSRGRVMLKSADPTDPPNLYLGTFSDKRDLKNVIRFIKEYLRIEKSTYFKSVKARRIDLAGKRCEGFDYDSDEYWHCYTLCLMMSLHHPSGTCAMGTVVDSNLRVYGVKGVRVVDTSIFPVITSGNTNAPAMAVAEKVADMIKNDYCK